VTFQWQGGQLCANYVWQVSVDGRPDLCAATTEDQVLCQLPPGEHQWNVTLKGADGLAVPGMETAPWTVHIGASTQP
jgi:hypothetical protein